MITKEASITILTEFSDFANNLSKKTAAVLLEHTEFNTNVRNLKEGKQLFYGAINSLGPIELEILKIYIQTNLTNGLIRPSKSLDGAPI